MEDHHEQIERQIATSSVDQLRELADNLERHADAVPLARDNRVGTERRAALLFLADKARREIKLR